MAGVNQDELKMNVKLWLKANNFDYAWLAERCFVTEATVRNWMAKKAHSRRQGTHHPGIDQTAPADSPKPGAGGRGNVDYPEA